MNAFGVFLFIKVELKVYFKITVILPLYSVYHNTVIRLVLDTD